MSEEEIKSIWFAYVPGVEAIFKEPAIYKGRKCILKSFEPSGEIAIVMQCQSLRGIAVVPECLSYASGPHQFYIISPHIELKDIDAPDLAPDTRETFYSSLASAFFDMHQRHVSFPNMELITQYDPLNNFAVINDFTMHKSFNEHHSLNNVGIRNDLSMHTRFNSDFVTSDWT